MRRKNSLIIPAVLAFSLCTVTAVPVLAEDAAQTEAEADTASDEASDAAEDTADTPYEKGTITETDYQSEWLNLKFTPPETVVMNTEEELESVMRQGQSTLEKSSGMELGEDALSGTVYEMMASSFSGFHNVSLVVEDASLENMTVFPGCSANAGRYTDGIYLFRSYRRTDWRTGFPRYGNQRHHQ